MAGAFNVNMEWLGRLESRTIRCERQWSADGPTMFRSRPRDTFVTMQAGAVDAIGQRRSDRRWLVLHLHAQGVAISLLVI